MNVRFDIRFDDLRRERGRMFHVWCGDCVNRDWRRERFNIPFGIIDLKLFDAIGIGGAGIMLLVYAYSGLVERGKLAKMDPPRKRGDS